MDDDDDDDDAGYERCVRSQRSCRRGYIFFPVVLLDGQMPATGRRVRANGRLCVTAHCDRTPPRRRRAATGDAAVSDNDASAVTRFTVSSGRLRADGPDVGNGG